MAVTVASIQSLSDQYIGDTSTNTWSAADRLRAISEAVKQLYSDFEFDFSNRTSTFNFFDGVTEYDITTDVPDFLEPVDLVRGSGDQIVSFTRKSPREILTEIDSGSSEDSFAIERKNRKNFVIVNAPSKFNAVTLHNCDSLTAEGTWAVDTATSDATNLTLDTVEFKQGSGSLNFDVTVAQSVNNRATVSNSTVPAIDLTDNEDLASYIAWVYIPESTAFSSVTVYWGSSSSAYWSGTVTTDISGAAFVDGWNRIKLDWANATKTGSPDVSAISYLRIDFNYTGAYVDDTDFRVDEILMVRPEKLTFKYQTWALGETSTSVSTLVYEFAATTNVPFFSGIYDYYIVYAAHLAAAILFRQAGLSKEADTEEAVASRELNRLKRKFPNSRLKITRNFKIQGLSWK